MPEKTISQSSPSPIPVAIVGAGPVGLSLALGLARLGVQSLLLEREPSTSKRSKAPGIHVRTLEIFRQWGVDQKMLEKGELIQHLKLLSVGEPLPDAPAQQPALQGWQGHAGRGCSPPALSNRGTGDEWRHPGRP
jgi:2-polyprenyl-6-methoxyphenol hydroxylase-like FAD-dependent oxidoreductase